jgi:hypothetical protein
MIVLFMTLAVFSQRKGPDHDKVRTYKIAYITEKLELTPEEAQQFWPVYNEMSAEIEKYRKETRRDMMKAVKEAGGVDQVSETESWKIVKKNIEIQKKMIAMEESMLNKLRKVLPNKKILKLQIAEREFKKVLFEKLRERRKKFREKRN